jgi:microcystin-dependent protein
MAFTTIPSAWTDTGKAITRALMDRIRTNLDDVNSRIDTISIAAGSKEIFNDLVEADESVPIGTVLPFSGPDLPSGFRFCDGSAVNAADFPELHAIVGANVPDMRGRTIVGKDNMGGSAANRVTSGGSGIVGTNLGAVGGTETHTLTGAQMAHNHTMAHTHTLAHTHGMVHQHNIAHTHGSGSYAAAITMHSGGTFDYRLKSAPIYTADRRSGSIGSEAISLSTNTGVSIVGTSDDTNNSNSGSSSQSSTASASTETTSAASLSTTSAVSSVTATAHQNTQPSIIQNYMIRALNVIDTNSKLIVKRINQAVRVNNVIVSPSDQGTSGTLELDIKKGTSIAGASLSIFSVKPTLDWNDTTAQSGTTDSNNNLLDVGDYLVISIETTQANLKSFHLLITGDL